MEAFKYQRELPPDGPDIVAGDRIQQLNKWPADRPLWRKTCSPILSTTFHMTCCVFSPWPSASKKTGYRFYRKPLTQVSLAPAAAGLKAFGNRPHTDETAFTIVCRKRSVPSEREAEWVSATPVDGSFVVNIGSYIARWTNGRFRSTLHRVVNRTGDERYSIKYFAIPDFDAVIECLPTCESPEIRTIRAAPRGAIDLSQVFERLHHLKGDVMTRMPQNPEPPTPRHAAPSSRSPVTRSNSCRPSMRLRTGAAA